MRGEEVDRCTSACKRSFCCHNTANSNICGRNLHLVLSLSSGDLYKCTALGASPVKHPEIIYPLQWKHLFPQQRHIPSTLPLKSHLYDAIIQSGQAFSVQGGFRACLVPQVCLRVCVGVTLTAKLHLPLRTASSSVCHWWGRLDSGT